MPEPALGFGLLDGFRLLSGGELSARWAIVWPAGWRVVTRPFTHSTMGGSTDGVHQLSLVVPMSLTVDQESPLALEAQPWIPVSGSVNPLHSGSFVDAPDPSASPQTIVDF